VRTRVLRRGDFSGCGEGDPLLSGGLEEGGGTAGLGGALGEVTLEASGVAEPVEGAIAGVESAKGGFALAGGLAGGGFEGGDDATESEGGFALVGCFVKVVLEGGVESDGMGESVAGGALEEAVGPSDDGGTGGSELEGGGMAA
jgi:hypothetical protein